MTVEAIREERERREAAAAERAAKLDAGLDLYADGKTVRERGRVIVECETHWDACLVLLAYGKAEHGQDDANAS